MADAYLGLGSNLGDRAAYLREAVNAIAVLPESRLAAESPVYETPPMGPQDQGAFLNMAVRMDTALEPGVLIASLQAIELQLGRPVPEQRRAWGPREIDIDVLLYGNRVIDKPGLTIPHAGMHDRWFVLRPLADLAPGMMHPQLGKTVAELLSTIESPAGVREFVA